MARDAYIFSSKKTTIAHAGPVEGVSSTTELDNPRLSCVSHLIYLSLELLQ